MAFRLGSLFSTPLLEHFQELLIKVIRIFPAIFNNHIENLIVLFLSINVPSTSYSYTIVVLSRVCVKWLLVTVSESFVLVLVWERY